MNEPRPPDETGPGDRPPPPVLEFKVDPAAARRVARVRMYVLGATVVSLLLAFVFVLSYRPRLPMVNNATVDTLGERRFEPAVAGEPALSRPPAPKAAQSPVDGTLAAVAAIDRAAAQAADCWVRAGQLMAEVRLDSAGAADAAVLLARAIAVADSAGDDVHTARATADAVRALSRSASGTLGFRLSVVYAAADRYVRSLEQDAKDRALYFRTLDEAVGMLIQGDQSGFVIKQNVANSYQRRSEERQRSVRRLAEELRTSARELPSGSS